MSKRRKKNSLQANQNQMKVNRGQVNRKFKDSLFRMVFRGRKELLSLYNAINKSDYQNPAQLEITTIEDAIYIGVKNDLSFLINDVMNLYEAQSSDNPNMPLRGLIYLGQLYQGYIAQHHLNIYSSSQLKLPSPHYIVLYNGSKTLPDVSEYRLSDSFEKSNEQTVCLECVATVLNINSGCNLELMSSCKRLYEYAYFVERVRYYLDAYIGNLEYAVDLAIKECISKDILKDFLAKHRAEVRSVILTEYDAKQHIEAEKSESYREGAVEGEARFANLSLKLLSEGRVADLEKAAQDPKLREELYLTYGI